MMNDLDLDLACNHEDFIDDMSDPMAANNLYPINVLSLDHETAASHLRAAKLENERLRSHVMAFAIAA